MNKLLKAFTRTKCLTAQNIQETELHRCLSTLDLTVLGVGSTMGAGIYVITGQVAKNKAGPAVVVSYLIAAITSILSGLCYAEFGARVPKAGSAYVYSYVTVGELCAFVIGWNLILEYIVGAASVAKGWSAFIDSMFHNYVKNQTMTNLGRINVPNVLSEYPDVLAFAFVTFISIILIAGVKGSARMNWIFTSINVCVVTFVTVAGMYYAQAKNWANFAPYGFQGVISGAATCFYSFVGFDIIATSGEEARTPSKSIPRAVVCSLLICCLGYIGVSVALTLMVPYDSLNETTAVATAFEKRGFKAGEYFVAVGAICALFSSGFGGLFPLPRILYAMGSDRVIFGFFARISKQTGTPFIACILSGFLTALLALLFELNALVEMMSIGTLLAYTIVALCVLLLRYKPGSLEITPEMTTAAGDGESRPLLSDINSSSTMQVPSDTSYSVVKGAVALFVVLSVILACSLKWGLHALSSKNSLMIVELVLTCVSLIILSILIYQKPQSKDELPFKMPLVPFLPLLSMFFNIYLILALSIMTWLRFAVWMTIGMAVYLLYGVKHSEANSDFSSTGNSTAYLELSNSRVSINYDVVMQ